MKAKYAITCWTSLEVRGDDDSILRHSHAYLFTASSIREIGTGLIRFKPFADMKTNLTSKAKLGKDMSNRLIWIISLEWGTGSWDIIYTGQEFFNFINHTGSIVSQTKDLKHVLKKFKIAFHRNWGIHSGYSEVCLFATTTE